MPQKEILFEFIPCGAYVKVCAIDEETGIEVQIVGSSHYPLPYLQKIATQKLTKKLKSLTQKNFI